MKNATLGVNFRAHFRTDKAGLSASYLFFFHDSEQLTPILVPKSPLLLSVCRIGL